MPEIKTIDMDEVREYVRHLTATPDVLEMLRDSDAQVFTIENLRLNLDGLLLLLDADPMSGYGKHSSEANVKLTTKEK